MSLVQWLKKIPSRLEYTEDLFSGKLMLGKATLGAKLIHGDGSFEDLGIISERKVTGAFVTFIVAQMVTDTTEIGDFKFHGTGIGTTAEANTQTALVDTTGCPARATGDQTAGGTAAAPTYTTVATVAYTSSLAITEHGVFSQATAATMLDRSVFSAINVVSGDSIQFTYVCTWNAEA